MERINFERLEFFEKRINEIFNQVTEENNLSLKEKITVYQRLL